MMINLSFEIVFSRGISVHWKGLICKSLFVHSGDIRELDFTRKATFLNNVRYNQYCMVVLVITAKGEH